MATQHMFRGPTAARETANCLLTLFPDAPAHGCVVPQEPGKPHWHLVPALSPVPPLSSLQGPLKQLPSWSKSPLLQPAQGTAHAAGSPVDVLGSQTHRPAPHHAQVSPLGNAKDTATEVATMTSMAEWEGIHQGPESSALPQVLQTPPSWAVTKFTNQNHT